jgi:hypothetical protein
MVVGKTLPDDLFWATLTAQMNDESFSVELGFEHDLIYIVVL